MPTNPSAQAPAQPKSQGGAPSASEFAPWEEASPRAFRLMSPEQKEAGKKIWNLIAKLVEEANSSERAPNSVSGTRSRKRSPLEDMLPPLDDARHNQVLLIDGTRGAGKTTLLVSMLRFWSNYLRNSPDVPTDWGEPGMVIPINILDMSPLPISTNLLVMLASGFQHAIKVLSDPIYRAQSEPLPSEVCWRAFLEVAGSAWDGNLTERRRELDGDTYVAELESVELRRLELRSRFATLIDALSVDTQQAIGGGKPIWLVPIDDADMNPGRTVELLEMLRSLYHPRVVFLLTGDSELFLDILRAHYLGVLTKQIQGIGIQLPFTAESRGDDQRGNQTYSYNNLGEDLYERSRRLAQDVYLKIIPPNHRCVISELKSETRRNLLLRELKLMCFHLDPIIEKGNNSTTSKIELLEFFNLFDQATVALPSRLRTINVIKDEMNVLIKQGQDYTKAETVRGVYNFLRDRWHYQLEKSDLESREVERLKGIIELSSHGEITVNLKKPNQSEARLITLEPENASGALQKTISSSKAPGDMLEIGTYRGFRARLNSRGRRLPEEITSTLLWALTMAPYSSLYWQQEKLSTRSICPAWCMRGHYVDRVADGMKETLWVGWPIPDWESPLLWMLMNKYWEKCIEKIDGLWKMPANDQEELNLSAYLAINFIRCVLFVCSYPDNGTHLEFQPLSVTYSQVGRQLKNLSEDMNKLIDLYDKPLLPQRKIDQTYWMVCRLPLLASCESGVHPEVANKIFEAWEKLILEKIGDKNKQAAIGGQVKAQRRHRIEVSGSKLAPGLTEEGKEVPSKEFLFELLDNITSNPKSNRYDFERKIEFLSSKSPGKNNHRRRTVRRD